MPLKLQTLSFTTTILCSVIYDCFNSHWRRKAELWHRKQFVDWSRVMIISEGSYKIVTIMYESMYACLIYPAYYVYPIILSWACYRPIVCHGYFYSCQRCCFLTSNYTERQKKLITSSEWHSLKSTASKWFIFGHRLGKFMLNKHI